MPFDIHGQYSGNMLGKDRQGHTTPDPEATELFRPWLTVPYPAPYLPAIRQDQGHPVLAGKVLSVGMVVGLDKSGAIVPAGMKCGNSGAGLDHANGVGYYALKYSQVDVDFGVINPLTGDPVTAGEIVYLAAPNDGVNTDVVTFPDGTTDSPSTNEITAAKACDLFPGGKVRPIGCAIRDVWAYIGGTTVSSTTNGILYTLDGVLPLKYKVHNYMHEMGTAIQTEFVLRLPWIGTSPSDLTTVATNLSITGYTQSNYGRSFVHFTGTKGASAGNLYLGCLVKASEALGDAGHYAPFVEGTDTIDLKVGRVIGLEEMYPAKDYLNRVRTLWDPSRLIGPVKDPNSASIMMGGSQTAGLPYQLNLGTDGLLKKCLDQGKVPDAKMYTFVYVFIRF